MGLAPGRVMKHLMFANLVSYACFLRFKLLVSLVFPFLLDALVFSGALCFLGSFHVPGPHLRGLGFRWCSIFGAVAPARVFWGVFLPSRK